MNYFGTIHDIPVLSGAVTGYLAENGMLARQWAQRQHAMDSALGMEETDQILYGLAVCCHGIGEQAVQEIIGSIDSDSLSEPGRQFLLTLKGVATSSSPRFLNELLEFCQAGKAENGLPRPSERRILH